MAKEARMTFELDGRRLEAELGLPFIAYMLNATEDEVRNRLRIGTSLREKQEAALAEIAAALAQLRQFHLLPEEGTTGYSVVANLLLGYHEQRGTTSVNALRQQADGQLPELQRAKGTLERSLEQLARDCYPAALLPPTMPDFPIAGRLEYLSQVMHRHPEKEVFEKLVMKDKGLARLFPDHSEQSGHTGSYYTNLGHGGGIQLWLLAENLVSAAYSSLALDGLANHGAVVERAVGNLTSLRKLVAGKGVKSKARLGIAGIQLQVDRFDTPWGVLRPTTSEERTRIGMGPARPTDAVLEVPIQLRLFLGTGLPPEGQPGVGKFGEVSARLQNDLQVRWTKLALSIFLGVEREPLVTGTHSWTIYDEVFAGFSGMSFSSLPWGGAWALTADELSAVGEWAELVDKRYHRSIVVATDRIIKAVAHRQDPADSLIDAVIALENLFGASSAQGELTFRISTGCAWLLEDTPGKRRDLRKAVKKIYEERSRIVHGNSPSPDAWQHRDRAVALVRRSLQVLLKDRPELISNRDRSSELSLGT